MTTHPNRSSRASAADLLMVAELALYQTANHPPHWADEAAARRGVAYLRKQATYLERCQRMGLVKTSADD